ncbi:MAG: hypothetical protein QOD06_3434 [Candidatus Binatota bacterium]|nr:hypothetical protein [Candidatus Binatota bacterium]
MAPFVLVAMVATTRPRAFLGSERLDAILDVVGLVVAISGQALRVLVIGLAYIKRGGRNRRIAADRLVSDGVFAHCRNPLYVGNFLMVLGLTLIWNSPWVYAAVLPVVGFAFLSIVRAEEVFLSGRFGVEYEEYCSRVPRFVPDFTGFGRTWARFEFDWRRVLRKEYGTTFSLFSTISALIALEKVERLGVSGASPVLRWLAIAWFSAGIFWASGRWLKKSGRLGTDEAS